MYDADHAADPRPQKKVLKVAQGQEPAASNFKVCFVLVDGKPLTVIGPPEAIDALEERLKGAGDVELHRFDRHPRRD